MNREEEEWQVEKILQRGKNNNATFYRVKWKGYPVEESTWEPITNLTNCYQLIIDFERELRERNHARRNRRDPARRINFSRVFPPPPPRQQHTPKMEIPAGSAEHPPIAEKLQENSSNPQERELLPGERTKERALRPFDHRLEVVVDQSDYEADEEEGKKRPGGHLQKAVEAPPSKKVKEDVADVILPHHNISSHHNEPNVQQSIEVSHGKESPKGELHPCSQDPLPSSKEHPAAQSQKEPSKEHISSQRENGSIGSQQKIQLVRSQPEKQSEPNPSSFQWRSLQRYQECDKQYEQFQRLALSNLVRRIQGKPRVKWGIAMMDLSSKQGLLSELYPIKQLQSESPLDSVEVLMKVEYGWMAVGKSGGQHVMMDVNFIRQQHWDTLLDHLGKQKS